MKNDYSRMTQGIDVGGVGVGMGRFDPVGQREGTGDDGGGGPNTRPSWPSMGRVIRCTLVQTSVRNSSSSSISSTDTL